MSRETVSVAAMMALARGDRAWLDNHFERCAHPDSKAASFAKAVDEAPAG